MRTSKKSILYRTIKISTSYTDFSSEMNNKITKSMEREKKMSIECIVLHCERRGYRKMLSVCFWSLE